MCRHGHTTAFKRNGEKNARQKEFENFSAKWNAAMAQKRALKHGAEDSPNKNEERGLEGWI